MSRIDVSAPFYNSPIPPEGPIKFTCPNRPYFGLWNYEVKPVDILGQVIS